MNLSDRISHPSAFQIRCGGFKGTFQLDKLFIYNPKIK
jgi:hypothetical protein